MATIHPFKAIRPRNDIAHLVPSRTYVSYTRQELINTLRKDPYTFLHIINPDWHQKDRTKPNSKEKFGQVRNRFEEFLQEEVLIEENEQSLYLYEQTDQGQTYIGLIGCASVDDSLNGTIKSHEQTLTKREELLKEYLKYCDINAEPVLLSYPDAPDLEQKFREIQYTTPTYDFLTTDDDVKHRLWIIEEEMDIKMIKNRFTDIQSLYIADGHHRTASSVRLAEKKRMEVGNYTGEEGFNYFMAYFLPESRMNIFGYHRCIRDLNGLSPEAFVEAVRESFRVERVEEPFQPTHVRQFGMCVEGDWYFLEAKPGSYSEEDPVERLDASLLYHNILRPILGIENPKESERVFFAGGPDGLQRLVEMSDKKRARVSFVLHPVTLSQFRAISDAGLSMPPKTTWIEPKLRSGLTIYRMDL